MTEGEMLKTINRLLILLEKHEDRIERLEKVLISKKKQKEKK